MSGDPATAASRPAVVLLVEDDENQVLLTQLAFEEAGLEVDLRCVSDGAECMAYLGRAGRDAATPWPDLVLLDVHLPRMDGTEVMAAIAASEELRTLVVVVLTTSINPDDLQRMYALRCNSYVVKPVEFKAFVETVRGIGRYWLQLAALPAPGRKPAARPAA